MVFLKLFSFCFILIYGSFNLLMIRFVSVLVILISSSPCLRSCLFVDALNSGELLLDTLQAPTLGMLGDWVGVLTRVI